MDVVIYLGAQNDPQGVLDEMTLVRAAGALDAYRARPGCKLLVTGGHGAFNRAPLPHAHYVAEHLRAQGVPADDLLPLVESRHTVEDAALARGTLAPLDVRAICVVTSAFHMPRARLIFSCFFDPGVLSFLGTLNSASREWLVKRDAHEQKRIAEIRQQGGVLYGGRLWPLPSASC